MDQVSWAAACFCNWHLRNWYNWRIGNWCNWYFRNWCSDAPGIDATDSSGIEQCFRNGCWIPEALCLILCDASCLGIVAEYWHHAIEMHCKILFVSAFDKFNFVICSISHWLLLPYCEPTVLGLVLGLVLSSFTFPLCSYLSATTIVLWLQPFVLLSNKCLQIVMLAVTCYGWR